MPIIIAGHSFGADIALWTEANARLQGVVGVLALGSLFCAARATRSEGRMATSSWRAARE